MTFMIVSNDREDVGIIDLGEFDGDDVWGALFALDNGGIYAHVETNNVMDVCEDCADVYNCYATSDEIKTEEQAIEFFGRH